MASIPNNYQCRLLVEQIVFGKDYLCPKCQNALKRGKNYAWCKACRKKWYPKSLTWFKGSKLSYQQMHLLILAWQKNIAPGAVKWLTGLSYTTTNRWSHVFRSQLPRDTSILEGTVEIDESYFGKRRFGNQRLVIGAVTRGERKLRLQILPKDSKDLMEDFVYAVVDGESQIHTDAHPGYYDLNLWGYGHQIWNHSKGHFSGTNQIEATWSVIKRRTRRMYGQMRASRLEEYLPEWEARNNYPHLFQDPKTYLRETLFAVS